MKKLIGIVVVAFLMSGFSTPPKHVKPNIIIVYVDDLGYGDVGCYGGTGAPTPHVDAMAKGGLRFTDAHCTAATCTPSRFSLLTGSYAFRNNAAILPGDAPLLIGPGTATLPGMLQKLGYKTGVVGKWHLGLGNGVIDWNTAIRPGPLEVGFDYSFIVPATLDRVPCVFVENHSVVNLDPRDPIKVDYTKKIGSYPTGLDDPELLKFKADTQHSGTIINGISRIGYMSGGKTALWKDEDMAGVLMNKVENFLTDNKDHPFFLYFSFTDIHVPRAPNNMFKGKSSMGVRGDDIAQMDWLVGKLKEKLDELGLTKNTLIIFTSDNGPVLDDGYDDKAEELVGAHKPAGPFKGGKYSAYEAGTRVPTIVYWPGKVKPGVSNALISQVDLYASLGNFLGYKLTGKEGPDSFEQTAAWLGQATKGRRELLEESFTLSLRQVNWKYITPISKNVPDWLRNKQIATGLRKEAQLYNLNDDRSESNNLLGTNPQKAKEMKDQMDKIVSGGGSRKGF